METATVYHHPWQLTFISVVFRFLADIFNTAVYGEFVLCFARSDCDSQNAALAVMSAPLSHLKVSSTDPVVSNKSEDNTVVTSCSRDYLGRG